MNALYLALLLSAPIAHTAAPAHAAASAPARQKDTGLTQYRIKYDHSALRIPGSTLPIGIVTRTAKGITSKTNGFLKGDQGWGKYKIEVQGGSFSGGKIHIAKSAAYQKGDSITVSVYTRKWFLGGKDKFLVTRTIPYDYEDSIAIITTGNIGKAPGDHVRFGVRTWYDNHQFADRWASGKGKLTGFRFSFDGTHLSGKRNDLAIEPDPDKISNDRVGLVAMLAKDSAIRDSLYIRLDYIAAYQCKVAASGDGHDLNISADVYEDTLIHAQLLRINVTDSSAKKNYHYRVNTNGGSIAISSQGGNGMDGSNGLDGTPGISGSDGAISVDVETTTASDGSIQTTTNTVQGAGSDGSPGGNGDDGEDGGNGGRGGNIFIRYTPAAAPFLPLIKALSIPGNGGNGGRGGDGGRGGSGGSGNPSGNNGSDGMAGRNGFDGAAGSKGKIVFTPIAGS